MKTCYSSYAYNGIKASEWGFGWIWKTTKKGIISSDKIHSILHDSLYEWRYLYAVCSHDLPCHQFCNSTSWQALYTCSKQFNLGLELWRSIKYKFLRKIIACQEIYIIEHIIYRNIVIKDTLICLHTWKRGTTLDIISGSEGFFTRMQR